MTLQPHRRPMARTDERLPWLAALLVTAVAAAAENPQSFIAQMDDALRNRNYQGVFVHEHGGQSETLRITHRVDNGQVSERIVSLDGSGREYIRRGSQITSYLPDQNLAVVDTTPDAGLLLAELRVPDLANSGQYRLRELAHTRTSGRQTRVIAVEPLDAMRYGYRLWIDEVSGMPLKTQLLSASGEVVEQLVFTDLRLPARIPDSELQPAVDTQGYRWLRRGAAASTAVGIPADTAWVAAQLPPGFRLTARSVQVLPGTNGPVTHLVYSDGLASVSVFVESAIANQVASGASDATLAVTLIGSTSAVSTTVQGHRVTAIGEVPPDTVRAIAGSVRAGAEAVGRGLPDAGPIAPRPGPAGGRNFPHP
jgi:sigma-E factor negative regulatory protein RseB